MPVLVGEAAGRREDRGRQVRRPQGVVRRAAEGRVPRLVAPLPQAAGRALSLGQPQAVAELPRGDRKVGAIGRVPEDARLGP